MSQVLKNKYYKLMLSPTNINLIVDIFTKIDTFILTTDGLYEKSELLKLIEPLKNIEDILYNNLKYDIERGLL